MECTSSGWTVILTQAKHVKKTLYACPRLPSIDSEHYRRPQSPKTLHMRAEVGGITGFETKTKVKIQHEKGTYDFDLQGVNFSLDSLLFLVV